jgi:hypothetical protein
MDMAKDLPGQRLLFEDAPPAPPERAGVQDSRIPIALPRKPTCTPVEAAAALGISQRQVRYWVDDGTLLAINSARFPVGPLGKRRSKYDRWRVVVRRVPEMETPEMRSFLTLEELVLRASNMEAK